MSGWRLIVREIHQHGPLNGTKYMESSIQAARLLGLIEHDERRRWVLTPLGIDFTENRVAQSRARVRPGGRFWIATWLQALPRRVRLARPTPEPDLVVAFSPDTPGGYLPVAEFAVLAQRVRELEQQLEEKLRTALT